MSRINELAALSARVIPVRVAATQDPSVTIEVAKVVQEAEAEVLAAAYNALPELVEFARILAKIEARRVAGKHTTLVADRKAMALAFEKFNA